MSTMSVISYTGSESTAYFDDVAGTVTFEHRHRRLPKKKRAASPWTVPVGAIDGISWREATAAKPGEMRLLLRGRIGYDKDGTADWSYISGNDKIGQLVSAINAAVQVATPITNFGSGYAPTRVPAAKAVSINVARPATEADPLHDNSGVSAAFGGIQLRNSTLTYQGSQHLVAGARAFVEIGGTQRRTTATRVVVGSVVTLGVGTLIGAMAKKKTNNIYLTVEFSDGQSILVESKARAEGDARRFAAAVNSAGKTASS
ncbi:DUF4429 domain-containing protein [Rhodococcus erythropolis]|uniref:DUF4429 domain-containing protein n=1 Tax=Rhodococcus erythropolis TaxID=1833 RepID=UPI00222791E8|nr:DUF4429 domain-containing protein [Rhodococcus erythropolis]MCW2300767.1 hypothetical protein [Rhodococcus erythropolis]